MCCVSELHVVCVCRGEEGREGGELYLNTEHTQTHTHAQNVYTHLIS